LTRNLNNNTPYYVINYDDNTEDTSSVTSGIVNKKIEIFRGIKDNEIKIEWKSLINSVKEIESIFKGIILDIEFAITKDSEIVIFQVRPLAANTKFISPDDDFIEEKLEKEIEQYLFKSKKNEESLILSDMAFWNPAELIGDRPDYLDYSLFNYLIMKDSWNKGICKIGYTKIDDNLLYQVLNKPYVNVNYSFLSLLPEALSIDIKNKLVKHYINKLKANPSLHDKVEFEIVDNCFTLDTPNRIKNLPETSFTSKEKSQIINSLKSLTETIVNNYKCDVKDTNASINLLSKQYDAIKLNPSKQISTIKQLIENCREYGVIPFCTIARMAFISKSILHSIMQKGYIKENEYNELLNSINTIASDFDLDYKKYSKGAISLNEFINKYGHLRPGTYNIKSLPYSYIYKEQKNKNTETSIETKIKYKNSIELKNKIDNAFKDYELNISSQQFLDFLIDSIKLREYYKFIYTKNISTALELIAEIGTKQHLVREDLAFLDYSNIVNHTSTCSEYEYFKLWEQLIKFRKSDNLINNQISLPSLIFDYKDLLNISYYNSKPNFITDINIKGDVILLDNNAHKKNIKGKIVLLEKADPGFDWIFTKNIKGLITKYGGVASHMSIRCAEFNIPAAIGCGELYHTLISAKNINLNCKEKTIIINE